MKAQSNRKSGQALLDQIRAEASIAREQSRYSVARRSILDPYRELILEQHQLGASYGEIKIILRRFGKPKLKRDVARSTIRNYIIKHTSVDQF